MSCCCGCRILPWWSEKTTVRRPVKNPVKSPTTTFLTVATVTPDQLHWTSLRTLQQNKPHTAASCRHSGCQRRRENESYSRASKFYGVVTVTRRTRLMTSVIDNIVHVDVVWILNVPRADITPAAQIHWQGHWHKLPWHGGMPLPIILVGNFLGRESAARQETANFSRVELSLVRFNVPLDI